MHTCIPIYAVTHTHAHTPTHTNTYSCSMGKVLLLASNLTTLCVYFARQRRKEWEKERERGSGIKLLCHGAAEIHFTCHSVWKKRNICAALRRANNFPLINIKSIFDLNNRQASREFMLLLLPHVACHIKCCKAIQFMRQFPLCSLINACLSGCVWVCTAQLIYIVPSMGILWAGIALIIGILQKLANILHTLCKWRSVRAKYLQCVCVIFNWFGRNANKRSRNNNNHNTGHVGMQAYVTVCVCVCVATLIWQEGGSIMCSLSLSLSLSPSVGFVYVYCIN